MYDYDPKAHDFQVGDSVRVFGGRWDMLRGTIVAVEPPQGNSIGAYLIEADQTNTFQLLAPVWVQRRYVIAQEPKITVTCSPGDTHFMDREGYACQCGLIRATFTKKIGG